MNTEKVHLYAEMKEFNREIKTEQELLDLKYYSVYRNFDSRDDMYKFIAEHPLKVHEGYYTVEDNGKFKIVHGLQGYASVFYYDKNELNDFIDTNNGSTSGYKGACYSDWFYIDVDSKVNPQDMGARIIPFLKYLKENSIEHYVTFSGGQGMHIYIPMSYIEVDDQEMLKSAHIICKLFLIQLIKQFPDLKDVCDPQVYNITTVFRMPFTINPKTGLMKTILTEDLERLDNNVAVINAFKRTLLKPSLQNVVTRHWKLDTSVLDKTEPEEVKFNTYFPCPYGEKACVYKLMNTHLKKGEHRHESALRLMSWFKNDKEFPNEFVWAFMKSWNKSLEDELTEQELKNVYKYVDTVNYNLCKDEFMDKYCPKTAVCQYWVSKSGAQKAVSVVGGIREMKIDALDTDVVDMGKIFDGMRLFIKPNRGFILPIIAGSKVGKTTISLNIALRAKIPTVIFSYEVSKVGLLHFIGLMLGLDPLDPVQQHQFIEETKHIFIVDEGRTVLQNIPNEVKQVELKHKVKIKMIILDYFQLIPVYDEGTTRLLRSPMERADTMSAMLPEMVKKHSWLCVIPTQPTKGVEGDGRVILMPDSGKGGQAIQAMGDAIMTAWRPYKSDDPLVDSTNDNVMSLWVGANRWDKSDRIRNYNYYGDRKLIQGIYTGEVTQNSAIRPKDA
jgi:hypothetical protein